MKKLTPEQGKISIQLARMMGNCEDVEARIGLSNALSAWENYMNFGVPTVSISGIITKNELDKIETK